MKVEILQNGAVIETKDLGEGTYKIGRATECEIRLKSPQISKQHALLVIKNERAAIVDVGSSNGIFINGVLVRKQRIEPRDTVMLGGFQLRVGFHSRTAAEHLVPGDGIMGNLATKMEPEAVAPPITETPLSPQERLVLLTEQKVLLPFFNLLKIYDWRWVLGVILVATLALSVLLSVVPLMQWGKGITSKEALERGHAFITQVVRENYRILTKTNDLTRLNVEATEGVNDILVTYIIDAKSGNILAPAKYFNSSITDGDKGGVDIYANIARGKILEGKEQHVSVDAGGGIWVIAQAIPHYESDPEVTTENKSLPQPTAIVLAYFKIPESINATFEPMSIAVLISVFLSLLSFLAITKMVSYPLGQLNEQLDAALKGEDVSIQCDWKLPELQTLATVINFSVTRMKKSSGGLAGSVSASSEEAEDDGYLRSVTNLDFGTSDGLLVLDIDKKIRFVGKAIEELIGLRSQYALGQNISDACRDQGFAGTAIDLAERAISSLGENQTATLDINGMARNMVAIPHKNSGGDIRFVLLLVKLGA